MILRLGTILKFCLEKAFQVLEYGFRNNICFLFLYVKNLFVLQSGEVANFYVDIPLDLYGSMIEYIYLS